MGTQTKTEADETKPAEADEMAPGEGEGEGDADAEADAEADAAKRHEREASAAAGPTGPERASRLPLRERLMRLVPELPALAIALVVSWYFGLSFGLNYGVDNQTAYMLGALRLLDPSVLAKDWYASGAANYHPAFSYVGWLLLSFDRGGTAVGWGLVAVTAAGAMCVYWLSAALLERRVALATFLLVMAIAFVTRTKSVAVSYIFDFILQPSTLGSLFLLATLPPFVAGRYLLSGVFLGLSGLFHANFLILGIGTFGLAHLVLGWKDGWKDLARRLAMQVGPPVLVFLILSPLILRSVRSPDAARAQEILFNIRSPHHYSPLTYKGGFFPVAAWQMLGLGAGGWLLRGLGGRGRRLGALVLSLAVLLWTGTLLTTWVQFPRVAQLFVWRFAPFLDLLMQLLICAASVSIAARPGLLRRIPSAGLTLALGGFVCLAMLDKPDREENLTRALWLALAPAALGALFWAGSRLLERLRVQLPGPRALLLRYGAYALIPYAVYACYRIGQPHVATYKERSTLIKGMRGPEADMFAWIRANTPKEATFLTPPQMERFRLGAERPIVVDWKGSAYVPSELVEWYRRLEDVSGRRGFKRDDDIYDGYGALDAERVERLKQKYGIDYVVVGRGKERDLPGKVVYQNGRFTVLDLRG